MQILEWVDEGFSFFAIPFGSIDQNQGPRVYFHDLTCFANNKGFRFFTLLVSLIKISVQGFIFRTWYANIGVSRWRFYVFHHSFCFHWSKSRSKSLFAGPDSLHQWSKRQATEQSARVRVMLPPSLHCQGSRLCKRSNDAISYRS